MNSSSVQIRSTQRSRSQQLRDAVVASFSNDADAALFALRQFNERDWQKNYQWMDASGLALYLLHHLLESGRGDILPAAVLARFQQNAADNIARTKALLDEAVRIRHAFASRAIEFVILKGFTLSPDAVSDPALRVQLDLDLLIYAEQADLATQAILDQGYELDVVSRDTWEFKAGSDQVASIDDLYKVKPQRAIELHLVHDPNDKRFVRARSKAFHGEVFQILSPVDLFLGQALHLFSHIASPFTRISWLLEFRQHVLTHRDNESFWTALRAEVHGEPKIVSALGIVTMMAEEIFGRFAPPLLRSWTGDRLASASSLWVKTYGRDALFADFPGTKLYLLLQTALGNEADLRRRDIRKRLLPLLRPRAISQASQNESSFLRLRRSTTHLRFYSGRLYFHVAEGLRYFVELPRWRRRVAEGAQ